MQPRAGICCLRVLFQHLLDSVFAAYLNSGLYRLLDPCGVIHLRCRDEPDILRSAPRGKSGFGDAGAHDRHVFGYIHQPSTFPSYISFPETMTVFPSRSASKLASCAARQKPPALSVYIISTSSDLTIPAVEI